MDIKTVLKSTVAAAALVAVAAPVVSGSAQAGLANGNDNGVVISGQLVRSLSYHDNGDSNGWNHIDGGPDTASRLNISVSGALTEEISVGGVWEADMPRSNAGGVSGTVGTEGQHAVSGDDGTFGFRKTAISFKHATLGTLSIGQDTTSSDIRPSLDAAGGNNSGMSANGNVSFYNETTNADTTIKVSDVTGAYWGGRDDRVRYDTPNIAGFVGSVSMIQDSAWDAGLTYGASYGDFQVAAALQYKSSASPTADQWGGGLAVLHSSGISAGGAYSVSTSTGRAVTSSTPEDDATAWHVEVGYQTNAVTAMGTTAVNVVYHQNENKRADDEEGSILGFHFNQNLASAVSVFANYEIAEYDNGTTTNFDDVTSAVIGTKISF